MVDTFDKENVRSLERINLQRMIDDCPQFEETKDKLDESWSQDNVFKGLWNLADNGDSATVNENNCNENMFKDIINK